MKKSGKNKVSVVITVLNEANHIEELLQCLDTQTLRPAEIIIVDAGSIDDTQNKVTHHRSTISIKLLNMPGNRSTGRNFGISHAKYPLIAITDAGCFPQSQWLEELIQPFSDSTVDVVSGYYTARSRTLFEKCLTPYVLVMPDRIPSVFLPSTRSMAIKKTVWEKTGGFNERVDPSEDYEYALRLQRTGYKIDFAQNALVEWIPRHNLSQAAQMFASFAYGDIRAGILRPKVKILCIRYLAAMYLFVLGFDWHWTWLILSVLTVAYVIWSIIKNYKYIQRVAAVWYLPLLQFTSDICVLGGTLVGIVVKIGS